MAQINVGEEDFEAVAGAAMDAKDAGHMDRARALDKIARKINLALSSNCLGQGGKMAMGGMPRERRTWRDMPSTIGAR